MIDFNLELLTKKALTAGDIYPSTKNKFLKLGIGKFFCGAYKMPGVEQSFTAILKHLIKPRVNRLV